MLSEKKTEIELLSIYINDRCNLDCLYCYKKETDNLEKCFLSFKEQKKVIKEAKRLGAKCILIAGKEPLIYKHIIPLISYIRKLGLQVILFTNGISLDKKTTKLLYDLKTQVRLKLDSLNTKIYEKLVNRKLSHTWVFHKYEVNGSKSEIKIPPAVKLLIDQGFNNKNNFPSLIIEVCINRLNYKTIPRLAKFCKNNNLGIRIERLITCGGASKHLKSLYIDEKCNKRLFLRLKKILGDEFIHSHSSSKCLLRNNPVIFKDGTLGFCLVEKPIQDHGNIKSTDLGRLFKKINKIINNTSKNIEDNFKVCPGRDTYLKKIEPIN